MRFVLSFYWCRIATTLLCWRSIDGGVDERTLPHEPDGRPAGKTRDQIDWRQCAIPDNKTLWQFPVFHQWNSIECFPWTLHWLLTSSSSYETVEFCKETNFSLELFEVSRERRRKEDNCFWIPIFLSHFIQAVLIKQKLFEPMLPLSHALAPNEKATVLSNLKKCLLKILFLNVLLKYYSWKYFNSTDN